VGGSRRAADSGLGDDGSSGGGFRVRSPQQPTAAAAAPAVAAAAADVGTTAAPPTVAATKEEDAVDVLAVAAAIAAAARAASGTGAATAASAAGAAGTGEAAAGGAIVPGAGAPPTAQDAAAAASAANPNRGWRGFVQASKVSNLQLLYPELLPPDGMSQRSLLADAPPLNFLLTVHYKNRATGKCMDVDVEDSRHVIRSVDCVPGRRRQQWDFTHRGELQSVHYAELCLALTSDSQSFYPAPCTLAMQTQRWEHTPAGTIHSERRPDLCLGTAPDPVKPDLTAVVIVPCETAATTIEHQWDVVPSDEPILSIVARFAAVPDDQLAAALDQLASALGRQQVVNRTDIVLMLPPTFTALPTSLLQQVGRGWPIRIAPRPPAPAGAHPVLSDVVQRTMQLYNMTLGTFGRFMMVLDTSLGLDLAGPYYLANAIWTMVLHPTANVALQALPDADAPIEAYQQGCLCLRSHAIPYSTFHTLTALFVSSTAPIMHTKLWRDAGGLRPIVGELLWPNCGMLAFWLAADAIVGLQLALVPAAAPLNVRAERPYLPVNYPRHFDECPVPPDMATVLPAELDGTAPSVTAIAIVTRSWVILNAPEFFEDDEILQAMCSLLQVEPAAVLGSPHFTLIKQLSPLSAHQRFIDGLRVEGTGSKVRPR